MACQAEALFFRMGKPGAHLHARSTTRDKKTLLGGKVVCSS